MSKSHRDNVKARKKRGVPAYQKRSKRRTPRFEGSWTVEFECGGRVYISLASSSDVEKIAVRLHYEKRHECQTKGCKVKKFMPEKEK